MSERGLSRALGAVVATALLASCTNAAHVSTAPSSTIPTTTSEIVIAATTTAAAPPLRCRPNDADGTVTLWHTLGGNAAGDLILQLEAEFNSSHRLQLKTEHVGGEPELLAKLAQTPFADWPDIVVGSERVTRALLDTEHFLAPLACDQSAGDDLLPLARSTYTMNAQLAALPWGLSVPVLMFNATKYSKAGLDPTDAPATLADLLDLSAKVTESTASPYGLVLSDWCGNLVLEQYAAQRGVLEGSPHNGHTSANVKVDFATPPNIADLTELREGVTDGHVLYIGDNGSGFDDLAQIAVPKSGGAMTIHTSAAIGDIIDLLDSGNFPGAELGVSPLPGPGVGSLVGGNALWMVDHLDPQRAGQAWTVLDWLYQPGHLAQLAAETGYVPPTQSALKEKVLLDRWEKYPLQRVAYDQLMATPVNEATSGMMIGPSADRDSILFGACTRIMASGADVESTLRESSQLVNDIIATYETSRQGRGPATDSSSTSSSLGDRGSDAGGIVSCTSGAKVVGVWVDAESGGSGWADRSDTGGGSQRYSFRLINGGRYRVRVGCGGSEAEWGTTNASDFISGSDTTFVCHDDNSAGRFYATCQQL